MKFNIGDKVLLKKGSPLYKSASSIIATSKVKEDKVTNITRYASGCKHPYNTTGDLGWMNESDIELYKPNEDKEKYEVEIELIDKDKLIDYLAEHENKIIIMDEKQMKDVFKL